MVTKSFTSLRRFSGHALTMMLFCASMSKAAEAQVTPVVAPSYAQALTPPSGLGTVFQTAIDSFGDLLFVDYPNGALYEYPAGGGPVITLLPAGSLGGYANPGIAIGANNDLYLEGNYNNVLGRFPYDAATKSWDGLSTISAANGNSSTALCPKGSGTPAAPYGFACGDTPNTSPYYFQPWAIAIDPHNNLLVTSQNSGNFIFTLPVVGTGITSTNTQANSLIISAMSARAQSVAEDKFGNVYVVEEMDQKKPLPGVLMIPAGSTGLTTDAGLTRVDPNLPAVTGVTVDANGNLYVSDSKQGVYFIPNPSGTPQTSSAVLLTPVPANGQVSIDWARGIMYVPSNQSGQQIYAVTFNNAALGTVAAGSSSSTPASILFGFNGSATPGSFVIEEAGAKTPDFSIASGGSCKAGTAYAANSSCSVNVTFNPHAAGSVSAKLLMLDGSGNVLASMPLSGTGSGPAIQLSPGAQSTIDSGLKTPSQIAVDAAGNTYVADTGFSAVQMFAKGSSTATSVGTGLTSPTGVAVDGAGDVFIADGGSGTVVEVPNGPSGLMTAAQVTLKSGLGANLKLATDANDDLYISDPSNGRVVKLSNIGVTLSPFGQTESDIAGFTAPSALAVDSSSNLYVADGSNLIEVTPTGTQTTLLTSLGTVSGLAVDPSGSVYVAQTGGTVRIPNESGTLNPADETVVASSVTAPASVALDEAQNIYIADSVAKDVVFIGANASVNFGTLSSTSATASSTFTILNDGNAPLSITGFSGTADYSGASSNCSSAIAVGGTCSVTVTFSPGPGDQGTLTGQVLVQSNAANSPVAVSATGVGAALAASTTKITVNNPTVNGAPTVITVTPSSGTTPTPTGQVTLTVTGNGITPITLTGTLSNGTVTLTPTNLAAATYQFAVTYQGDRAYAGSSATSSVKVGAGAVSITQPTMAQVQKQNPYYPLVLGNAAGAAEPYDGSVSQYLTTAYYTVTVLPTDGQPLIGQSVLDQNGKVIGTNYGSVTFQGASTSTCAAIPVQSNGTAQFDPSCLTIDTSNNAIPDILTNYTVTPVYSPTGAGSASSYTNPNYTAFTGTAINYTALRNPMVSISSNPGSLSVTKGSSASATLTLTSILGYGIAGYNGLLNNYSLPVQLACDGLPAYATCTFVYPKPDPSDPNSVHVGPATGTVLTVGGVNGPCTVAQGCSGPGTVIMTITTTVPTGVAMLRTRPTGTVFFAMLGLGALGFAFRRKRSLRSRIGMLALLALCCGILAGASGCSTTQLGGSTAQVTPSGTYTVQVTAKEVGSQVITQNPYITYGNGNQMSLPFTMQVTVQ
ncbi:MAG TPA: choice-of-anchor D domain-containing protein [Acidobacteriaceae bacterium]|nr:choice-of-anchor D domain-containing protein [Acidobacteriaceae bacterium]